jgi:hypothetical protein
MPPATSKAIAAAAVNLTTHLDLMRLSIVLALVPNIIHESVGFSKKRYLVQSRRGAIERQLNCRSSVM